ncbi:M13 family metallopeptidase [Polyangium fumosum]|uniref:M13 family peptidase n=1 Tax=Polyangium fumosum TaxID=889272 RepID=A0A4U1JGD1_9BACT|nr:M13 family metallopeptidase [Polyangium fumosum]TKD10388.1 M13 family peptidase [Polyangium fumosum]
MRTLSLAFASVAMSLLAGCGSAKPEPITNTAGPVPTVAPPVDKGPPSVEVSLESVGLDGAALDKSVNACTDFYQFACGGWLKSTEIPSDEANWVRSFSEIDKRNELALKTILEDAGKAKNPDSTTKKIGDYYAACMDEASVDAAGITPIKPLVDRARKVASAKDVTTLVSDLHAKGIFPLFWISGEQDPGDATRVIATLDQGGLGLPDRDYYTKDDDDSKKLRADYVAHVERMLKLAGLAEADAKKAAANVLALETDIAKVSKTRVERRDPKGIYNMVSRADLAKKAPAFPWDAYFKALGISDVKQANLTSIPFFEGIDKLLGSVKADVWQSYLTWMIVRASADELSKPFVDEAFAFRARLFGLKEQKPRWKRCVDATDHALGELVAQPFVASHFAGDSKRAAEQMVQEISKAFGVRVRSLDWMDDKTKERALAKLSSMAYLIGYPAKWRSYDFEVDRKSYGKNAMAAGTFEQKRRLAKIGKPVDREEWQMSPPMVNAYYDPQKNHMVFPAGILQPPFYDVKAAIQVNLGGMGMVVGHELTHGFDDEGSQYAGNGNLENWWEPSVGELFKKKTTCVEEQYSKYEPLPGVKLNGKLTLGENIADLGGLRLAFMAYREMRKGAANMTVAGGFTEDQQFFLAHAQAWCAKSRDEYARLHAKTNTHSAPRFRVNGPLVNTPEFAQAFSCAEGTPMHPAKVCSVW